MKWIDTQHGACTFDILRMAKRAMYALQVWDDAQAAGCEPDCRMSTALIEVCMRKGDTPRALAMYASMREAPSGSRRAPSVHAFTAAMRAAAEGGCWERALNVWADMEAAGCRPTGAVWACSCPCSLYLVSWLV